MSTSNPDHDPAPSRRRRLVTAGATGLTVAVVAAGAFAAYQIGVFGAPGDQPATVIPDSAVAYAAIDFNPSAKAKLGAYELVRKFPSADVSSEDSVKDDLLGAILDGEDVNYARDIKPWLGDRAAFALLPAPGTDDGFTPLAVLAVTDRDAARAGLTALEKEAGTAVNPLTGDDLTGRPAAGDVFSYAFKDGYVLVGDNQKEVDAATAATRSLADDPTFAHDIDALGPDQLARAWVDTRAAFALVPDAEKAGMPAEVADRFSGTLAVGAHADGDYLEIVGQSYGGKPTGTQPQPVGLTGTFPADTDVAVEVTGLGRSLTKAWGTYRTLDPFAVAGQARQIGIRLPDDLMNVFGSDFAVAVKAAEQVQVAVGATTPDPGASKRVVDRLLPFLGADASGVRVTSTAHGYAAATDPGWLHQGATGTGTLTDTDAFRRAVPDAADANAFVYVDIADLARLFDSHDRDLGALEAFGASATTDGTGGRFRLRLTVK